MNDGSNAKVALPVTISSRRRESVLARLPRPVALVVGGGGFLGAAHVGVGSALEDHGFVPDLIVGTSVGALNGAIAAADRPPAGYLVYLDGIGEMKFRDSRDGGRLVDQLVARAAELRVLGHVLPYSPIARQLTDRRGAAWLRRHTALALFVYAEIIRIIRTPAASATPPTRDTEGRPRWERH